jgi:hypothetical protein
MENVDDVVEKFDGLFISSLLDGSSYQLGQVSF